MRAHTRFLTGAAIAALAGALIGVLIVWAAGARGSGDAPGADVAPLTATPDLRNCAAREELARATPIAAGDVPGVQITRGGVRLSLPPEFSLAPNGTAALPDTAWFFSSAIDAIDPAVGVRIGLGVYPSAGAYLGVNLPPPAARNSPAPPGTPAPIGETFLFDTFRSSLPAGGEARCDHGTGTAVRAERNETLTWSDLDADEIQLHQRAMLLLADGRVVVLAIDGVPDVVPWARQRALFSWALTSIAPAE